MVDGAYLRWRSLVTGEQRRLGGRDLLVFFILFQDRNRGDFEDQDLTPLGEVYDLHVPGYGYLVPDKLVGILYGRHIYLRLQDVARMFLSGFHTRALELSFEVGHGRSPFRVSGVDIVPSFANEDRAIVFYARHGEGLRPSKVLLEGFGPPAREPGVRPDKALAAGAKPYEERASGRAGCALIARSI